MERKTIDARELSLEKGFTCYNCEDCPNAYREMQFNIMNACSTALVAPDSDRWALAGDQLYVDLDFSPVDPHVEWRQRSVESDERGYLSREQSRLRSLQVLVREGPLQPPEMAASGYR